MISDNLAVVDGLELEPSGATSTNVLSKLSSIASIAAIPQTQLKTWMRTTSIGLDDPVRRTLWLGLALRNNRTATAEDFDNQFDNLTVNKLPVFVDPTNARFFALNSKARRCVATILWNLSQSYPQMTFAPLLYPLVSLFLHFNSPADVYRSVVALLTSRESRYISINRIDKSRDAFILVKLTNKFGIIKRNKFGSNVREKLKNNHLDAAFVDWIQCKCHGSDVTWIFACLPLHFCVRIVDCYLVEGEKFLYRVALVLAQLYEKQLKQPISLERMRSFCEDLHTIITPQQLINNAIKLTRFSKKDLIKARLKAEKRSENIAITESPMIHRHDIISPKEVVFGTRIAPRKFKSSVLSWNQLDIVWEWIPERIYVMEPLVVFCSDEHGNSLQTFYSLCGDYEPTILLVKTLNNEIFGAYCSAAWSKRFEGSLKPGQYFGNGETFLFSIAPKAVKYEWVGKHRDASHLSAGQQLFLSATSHCFSVGGGTSIGLYIDENLSRGESHSCDSFENEPLTQSNSTYFDISVVEVISFC